MILMGIPTRVHHSVCTWNVPADEATFQYRSTYIHCLPISDKTVIQLNKKKMSVKNNHLRDFKTETSFWSVLCVSALFLHLLACAQLLNGEEAVETTYVCVLVYIQAGWSFVPWDCPCLYLDCIGATRVCLYSSVSSKNSFLVLYPNLLSSCGGINIHLISR